ncbi:MAG: phenylalanine--tRNA ligase subunit alpha [Clostridiales bacterium]|jgi:phenylalanyl-tRNA synthetase alpha chain|nr:phenylalanine--tRNA ligase subunit alpha [Clostridiales bacterium]
MNYDVENIKNAAIAEVEGASDLKQIDDIRIKYLGKKGEITQLMKTMGALPADERPAFGAIVNSARGAVEDALNAKKAAMESVAIQNKMLSEKIDVTMPGVKPVLGSVHPLTKVLNQIKQIFVGMGFVIAEGPEVEKDYYNFDALNIPPTHSARDEDDTFYIDGFDDVLLRTQTSSVQIRVMEHQKPPIRMVAPGRVYRSDAVDATHSPMFHQIEGLVVDKGVTMADLKGTLSDFVNNLYGEKIDVRFRPHHFQFTEPSAEMDISCPNCGGKGCNVCKGEGWIEILGAGMVHAKVLERCGIDPNVYSGFAFGLGLERIAMRSLGINDLRLFYENDVRFLNQF